MTNFDIIWKFAIIGFLLAMLVQMHALEKTIEKCLLVPEPELPTY
jgi:hypothetical protein